MTDVYYPNSKLPMVQQEQQHRLFPGGRSVDVENWSRHVVPPTLYSPRPRTYSPPPPHQSGSNINNNNNNGNINHDLDPGFQSDIDKNDLYRHPDTNWVPLASLKPTDTLPPISAMLRKNRPKSSPSGSRHLPKLRTEFGPYHVDSSASLQGLMAMRTERPLSAEITTTPSSLGRHDLVSRSCSEKYHRPPPPPSTPHHHPHIYHYHNNNNHHHHHHKANRSESLHYGSKRRSHSIHNGHRAHTPTSPTSFPCRLDRPSTVVFPSPRLHGSTSSAGSGHNHTFHHHQSPSQAIYSPAASEGSIGVIPASTSPTGLGDDRLQRYCNHLQLQKSHSQSGPRSTAPTTASSNIPLSRRASESSVSSVIHNVKNTDDLAANITSSPLLCRPCASRESSSTVMINTASPRSSPRISVAKVFSNHGNNQASSSLSSSTASPHKSIHPHPPYYRFARHSSKKNPEHETTSENEHQSSGDNNNHNKKHLQRAKLQPGCVIC